MTARWSMKLNKTNTNIQKWHCSSVSDYKHLKLLTSLNKMENIWLYPTEKQQIKINSGPDKNKQSGLPAVFAESRDEVSLLVFRIEEENRPVQRVLLVQEDLSACDLLRAETVQAQLWYRCWGAFILILAVRTTPTRLGRLEELNASILCEVHSNVSDNHWKTGLMEIDCLSYQLVMFLYEILNLDLNFFHNVEASFKHQNVQLNKEWAACIFLVQTLPQNIPNCL